MGRATTPARITIISPRTRSRHARAISISICPLPSPAVAQQLLVYAVTGHFTKIESVAQTGPRHRLSPAALALHDAAGRQTRAARRSARRWVLLGTFLYADAACTLPRACCAVGSMAGVIT